MVGHSINRNRARQRDSCLCDKEKLSKTPVCQTTFLICTLNVMENRKLFRELIGTKCYSPAAKMDKHSN